MTKKQLRIKDIVVLVVFLAFAAVAIKLAVAQVSGPQPQRGDWLCWATSTKDPECGTYGWHKRKPIALKVATDLCDKRCGQCVEDYCEVVK